jgi:hypothetical protein
VRPSARIAQYCYACNVWYGFFDDLQPLPRQLRAVQCNAGYVATRSREDLFEN